MSDAASRREQRSALLLRWWVPLLAVLLVLLIAIAASRWNGPGVTSKVGPAAEWASALGTVLAVSITLREVELRARKDAATRTHLALSPERLLALVTGYSEMQEVLESVSHPIIGQTSGLGEAAERALAMLGPIEATSEVEFGSRFPEVRALLNELRSGLESLRVGDPIMITDNGAQLEIARILGRHLSKVRILAGLTAEARARHIETTFGFDLSREIRDAGDRAAD